MTKFYSSYLAVAVLWRLFYSRQLLCGNGSGSPRVSGKCRFYPVARMALVLRLNFLLASISFGPCLQLSRTASMYVALLRGHWPEPCLLRAWRPRSAIPASHILMASGYQNPRWAAPAGSPNMWIPPQCIFARDTFVFSRYCR